MKVTCFGQTYDCAKAVRRDDSATLYLTDGGTVQFSGVTESAWECFTLEDGSWVTEPTIPSDTARIDALESAMLAMMMGGSSNV